MPVGGIGTAFREYLVEELQAEHNVLLVSKISMRSCVHAQCSVPYVMLWLKWLTYCTTSTYRSICGSIQDLLRTAH